MILLLILPAQTALVQYSIRLSWPNVVKRQLEVFIDFSVSVSFFVQWCQLIPVILLFFRVQASRLVGE